MADTTIHAKLVEIQQELKVPKGQTNNFGGYKYRSAEDILEAVKPLCNSRGLTLRISDEIVEVGGRIYVKSVAMLNGAGKDEEVFTIAYAREEESKKGMDSSQLTGATSSYSRKYALNGLFAIDDTKDADTQDNREHKTAVRKPEVMKDDALAGAKDQLNRMFEEFGYDNTVKKKAYISKVLKKSTVDTIDEADLLMAELTSLAIEIEGEARQ